MTDAGQIPAFRVRRLADIASIARVQREFGYFIDEGRADDAARLFAPDGTVEYGLDGVFRGRERVRGYLAEYLRDVDGGSSGDADGDSPDHDRSEVPRPPRIHLQVMPVITLEPGADTAKATWRQIVVGVGRTGEAIWGEGAQEVEYVRDGESWLIRSLHWFPAVVVPFHGGWPHHPDVTGGLPTRGALPPDGVPTVTYEPWPHNVLPSFHFRGLPAGRVPVADSVAVGQDQPLSIEDQQRLDAVADQAELENLQRIFGYYLDKGQWEQVADLFADDGTLHIDGIGGFRGRSGLMRWLESLGPSGPEPGRLLDTMVLQPVIDVAPDRSAATGRWRLFSQLALAGRFHEWGLALLEARYVRDGDGSAWRIGHLRIRDRLYTPYDDGWDRTLHVRSGFERLGAGVAPDVAGPALPVDGASVPGIGLPEAREGGTHGRMDVGVTLARMARLEDRVAIENLQNIYGYYLATLEWDALADLFADDGTIEIALRGVYVGRDSVRRNLNLYGEQGGDDGVLHNHMQFQPVIHVDAEGITAHLRSRALSMMGMFGQSGMWMAGTYENEFVKVGDTWKFRKDQVVNTYFAPYNVGWKDLPQRSAPGITESNPPDRPPSFPFDLYPKNFLLPYHYRNPVSGR